MIGQKDRHAIGVRMLIAGRQSARDARGLGVVQTRADIQHVVVIEHADLGTFRGWLPLVGIALPEVIGDGCMRPGFIGQATIDDGRAGDADGANSRTRGVSRTTLVVDVGVGGASSKWGRRRRSPS
jgi:hypothetical protein